VLRKSPLECIAASISALKFSEASQGEAQGKKLARHIQDSTDSNRTLDHD
jgi:hypothetical protein